MTKKAFNLISKITEDNLEYSKWGVTTSVNTRDYFDSVESINLPENGQYLYIYFDGGVYSVGGKTLWGVGFFGTPDWIVSLNPAIWGNTKVGIYKI